MSIEQLKKFVNMYHSQIDRKPVLTNDVYMQYMTGCSDALYNTYYNNAVSDNRIVRCSNVYKPGIVHALHLLGYREPECIRLNRLFAMFFGHVIEALVIALLKSYNVPIHSEQREIVYKNTITGHCDFCIDDAVVDVKSMPSSYFDSFCREPNDHRGYITQLHTYCHALGANRMYVLAVDKLLPRLRLVEVPYMQQCLDVVDERLARLQHVTSDLNSAFNLFDIPQPVWNARAKQLQVPESFRYDWYMKNLLYNMTEQGEFDVYCHSARSKEEVIAYLTTGTNA